MTAHIAEFYTIACNGLGRPDLIPAAVLPAPSHENAAKGRMRVRNGHSWMLRAALAMLAGLAAAIIVSALIS